VTGQALWQRRHPSRVVQQRLQAQLGREVGELLDDLGEP
jgi:hypothetical protein